MSNFPKEILRNYVREQNFTSPDDILDAMKDMFKDILQEALEAEMDSHLGYDKNNLSEKQTQNRRNGYSNKTLKSELGPVKIDIPRDRNGEFDPQILPKHQRCKLSSKIDPFFDFFTLNLDPLVFYIL